MVKASGSAIFDFKRLIFNEIQQNFYENIALRLIERQKTLDERKYKQKKKFIHILERKYKLLGEIKQVYSETLFLSRHTKRVLANCYSQSHGNVPCLSSVFIRGNNTKAALFPLLHL